MSERGSRKAMRNFMDAITNEAVAMEAAECSVENVLENAEARDLEGSLLDNDLQRLIDTYSIPPGYVVRLPTPSERTCFEVVDGVIFFEEVFKVGVRLPLHPFLCEVLSLLDLHPSQLMPNVWRYMLGLFVLCREMGRNPTGLVFHHFIKVYPRNLTGWCTATHRSVRVFATPATSSFSWKTKFFVVSFPSDAPPLFPTKWQKFKKLEEEILDKLSEEEHETIQLIEDRVAMGVQDFNKILTLERLVDVGLHMGTDTTMDRDTIIDLVAHVLEGGPRLSIAAPTSVSKDDTFEEPFSSPPTKAPDTGRSVRPRLDEQSSETSRPTTVLDAYPRKRATSSPASGAFQICCSALTTESALLSREVAGDLASRAIFPVDRKHLMELDSSSLAAEGVHHAVKVMNYMQILAERFLAQEDRLSQAEVVASRLKQELEAAQAQEEIARGVARKLELEAKELRGSKVKLLVKLRAAESRAAEAEARAATAVEAYKASPAYSHDLNTTAAGMFLEGWNLCKQLVLEDNPTADLSRLNVRRRPATSTASSSSPVTPTT